MFAGIQRANQREFGPAWLKRNLAPYRPFGLDENLQTIRQMSDTQRYRQSVTAVLRKNKIKPKRRTTT